MRAPHPALVPVQLGPLALRNRIVKTATNEGMSPGGRVSQALVDHHAGHAANQVALTTVAYGAVEPSGRTFADQLLVDASAGLERIARAVHARGGAVSLQLAHCGGFSKLRSAHGPSGPSGRINAYGLAHGVPWIRAMGPDDMARAVDAYARAARVCRDAGFDAVELHLGHGYLLSQFLSPFLNRRHDRWGGTLANRLRFPLEVVRAVREAVGSDLALLAKVNLSDGVRGGLEIEEAVEIAIALAGSGVDALVPSGGLVSHSAFYLMRGEVPLRGMAENEHNLLQRWAMRALGSFFVRPWPYSSRFFAPLAARIRDAVDIPVGLLGGIDSDAAIRRSLDEGFAFVVLGRALLADPDLVPRLADGRFDQTRCTHCNACVVEMDRGGVRCILQ